MVLAVLVFVGFLLLVAVLPMWLLKRHGRNLGGSVVDEVNYDNPYPKSGMFATRDDMGPPTHTTRQDW
jgi:hypothetical protein